MQSGMMRSRLASVFAFGHMSGMQSRHRHRQTRAVAKTIVPMELTMTARDMGVTFESNPELYRACHPLFNGREKAEPEIPHIAMGQPAPQPQPQATQSVQQEPGVFKPRLGWTWEV